jgi:hypothetical protein
VFSDPTSITIDSVAKSLPRVSVGNMTAAYRSADGSLELSIAHSANKRERSVVKVVSNKVGTDPFDTSRQRSYTAQAYTVIDAPLNGVGYTDAELEDVVLALVDFLKAPGTIAKLLGKES